MSTSLEKAKNLIALFSKLIPFEKVLDMVTQDASGEKEKFPRIPEPLSWSREAMEKRQAYIQQHTGINLSFLSGRNSIRSCVTLFSLQSSPFPAYLPKGGCRNKSRLRSRRYHSG